jgi:hypothetical protein
MVYAALIPIIGGVGLASLKELSFTWTALIAASLANQAAALKNVVSKVSNLKNYIIIKLCNTTFRRNFL